MRKQFILAIVMCLVIGLFSGFASAEKIDTSPLLKSDVALVQVKSSEVSQSVIDYFEANDVTVDENSIIEVLPLKSNDNTYNTVLGVTNEQNGKIYKDILVTHAEENDGTLSVVDVLVNSKNTSGGVQPFAGAVIEFPPDSWDDRLTIRATAVFDHYMEHGIINYYRPLGAFFTYTKGTANQVNHISIEYYTEGAVYSVPNFVYQNRIGYHLVVVSQSNPNESTMYSTTNNFESGMAMLLSGSPGAGQSITFDFVADGVPASYTVPF